MPAARFDKAYILAARNELAQLRAGRALYSPRTKAARRRLTAIRAIELIRQRNAADFKGKWIALAARHAKLRQTLEGREGKVMGRLSNALATLAALGPQLAFRDIRGTALSQQARRDTLETKIAAETRRLAAEQRAAFLAAASSYRARLDAAAIPSAPALLRPLTR